MTSTNPTRLGILGGGQLARMLAESALAQSTPVTILLSSAEEPAALPDAELVFGGIDDSDGLAKLFAASDVVTFESEFVDLEVLRSVMAEHPEVEVRPRLESIAVAQDKLAQKRLFDRLGVPSAPFDTVSTSRELEEELTRICETFSDGFVLKWSRFGYDGKGNHACPTPDQLDHEAAAEFCRSGWERGGEVYAEAFVDFSSEVAMVSGRRADGQHMFFPLVVSRQERGVCRDVYGPADRFDIPPSLEERAQETHRLIGGELEMTGVFAIEFFVTRDGTLLANEMAPRVHNTGHYTLWPGETSQFDVHIQAVLGRDMQAPEVHGVAVMRNILGPWDLATPVECERPQAPLPKSCSLYWYEKRLASAGRKLGHLTGRANSASEALALLAVFEEFETRHWKHATNPTQP